MTPFEEMMSTLKQVEMLLESVTHDWNYDSYYKHEYTYFGLYTAVTWESALLIHELLHGKKNITCHVTNTTLHVECPISHEEREKVRNLKDY